MQELLKRQSPNFSGEAFEISASKVPLQLIGAVVHLNLLVVTDSWLDPEAGDLVLVAGQVAAVRGMFDDRVNVVALDGPEFLVRREATRVVVSLLCPAALSGALLPAVEGLPAQADGGLVSGLLGGKRAVVGRSNGVGAFPIRVSQGNRVRLLSCGDDSDD